MLEPRYVDSRETPARKSALQRAGFQVRQLDSGDVQFPEYGGEVVLIEHKTVSLMLQDMANGTLARQARRMVEHSRFPILLVEGAWRHVNGTLLGSQYTWEAAWNQLQSLQDAGLRLQLSTSEEHSIQRIMDLADYYGEGYHPSVTRRPAGSPQVAALSNIFGIDVANATKLLEHFYTLDAVATAALNDLMAVKGIGPITAGRIKAFFQTPFTGGVDGTSKEAVPEELSNANSDARTAPS